MSSYVQQLETVDHQDWVKEAIEKEKLKKSHLQVVIQHLESEVSNLSKETIRQMEESMMQVHVYPHFITCMPISPDTVTCTAPPHNIRYSYYVQCPKLCIVEVCGQ